MNWWMFVKCERPTASPMDIINKMSEIGSLIECQCRSRAQDKEPSSTPKLTGDADENRRFSDCKFVCLASKSPPIHNVDTYIYIYMQRYTIYYVALPHGSCQAKRYVLFASLIRRKQVQLRRFLVVGGNTRQPNPSGFKCFVTLSSIMQK